MRANPPHSLETLRRGTTSRVIVIVVLLLFLGTDWVAAQSTEDGFHVSTVSVRELDQGATPRLDLYVGIPHSDLQFLKVGDRFEARYELSAAVYEEVEKGERGELVSNPVWADIAQADQFRATQSALHLAQTAYSLRIPAGQYLVELKVRDLASDRELVREMPVQVRSFATSVSVSDLVLVKDYSESRQTIYPIMDNRVFTRDGSFSFFYELYSDADRSIQVTREVARVELSRGVPVLRWFSRRWKEEEVEDLSYTTDELTRVQKGRNPFLVSIPVSDFPLGEYIVRVRLEDPRSGWSDTVERRLYVDWGVEEYKGRTVDEAIAQLSLVAKGKELAHIQDGETAQERWQRFQAFWAKRDPTPDTPDINERLDEYYFRIDYANQHYGGRNHGWQTDRGFTLVVYGEPDQIERSNANVNASTYEVWHYNRIGQRFVFVDRSGRGNFELVQSPTRVTSRIR